jgi:hypothetical protein
MELDELKASWQSLDRRVDALTAINHRLLIETLSRKARWRLAPVVVGAVLNIAIGGCFAVAWGRFWAANLATPVVAAAGIALHAVSILLIVIGGVRLYLALRIDYSKPVLAIQRSLAALQEFEARSFHAMWFGCCMVPVALVAMIMGFAGVDFWKAAPGYVVANFIICFAVGLAPWLLHRWARHRRGRLGVWMDDFLLNRSVARARETISEIDGFVRNP